MRAEESSGLSLRTRTANGAWRHNRSIEHSGISPGGSFFTDTSSLSHFPGIIDIWIYSMLYNVYTHIFIYIHEQEGRTKLSKNSTLRMGPLLTMFCSTKWKYIFETMLKKIKTYNDRKDLVISWPFPSSSSCPGEVLGSLALISICTSLPQWYITNSTLEFTWLEPSTRYCIRVESFVPGLPRMPLSSQERCFDTLEGKL